MPTGKIWRRDASSTQTAVLTGIANAFYESGSEAYGLIAGSFPATATTMLSEWESTMALPDDCTIGETYSTSARQLAVSTKLATAGGQSVAHFTTAAKALGYDITITEYRPARAGLSRCGASINGNDWRWVWKVTAPDTTITWAHAGEAYANDPIDSWGNKLLECRLKDMSPSHTILLFTYETAESTA
ncbi:YmfQ family protein [Pantoea stewartii]|nr:putative phage tail protein [Pantoea stewartii]EHT97752.1 hypothetical protein CKS_5615 [Pantoea stewartii subsp. stewartii DC283]KAB0554023.1 DUF2313 domain-containing protein [Pantoea stewartii subsp. stewartii]